MFAHVALYGALVGTALGGTILWDGRFNNMTSSTELDDCTYAHTTFDSGQVFACIHKQPGSFSNEVGQYQYYIHGDGAVTEYVNLGADFGNPADSGSNKGVKITIDNSSVWNSDNMLRTELIPQTSAAINSGKVFYHFSMQHTGVNPPSAYEEHQVCFFESHFTEMKYGLISGEQGTLDTTLQWYANSASQWSVNFTAGIWHNIAYAIDFDASTVAFYHSTGADDLALVVEPVSASTSSNGADWHLGVLRLPSSTGRTDTAAEDWYFSGVYIETGDLTTSVSGPGGSSSSAAADSAASSTNTAAASSSSAVASPSTAAATTASTVVAAASAATTSASVSSAVPTTLQTVASTSSASVVELASTVTVVPVASASASTAWTSSAAASAAVTTSSAAAASASATATAAAADVDVTTASSLIPVSSSTSAAASTSAPASSPAGAATTASSATAAVETEGACKVVYVYADEL